MPRDGTATRTRILDAAQTLMERNGVTGTSVDQILDAAHTSKGAFFHHFDSKRELTAVLMERYVEADLGQLRAGLAAVETITDPVERALGFARYFERWAEELVREDSACLYIAALSERDLLEGPVHDSVRRAITTWRARWPPSSRLPSPPVPSTSTTFPMPTNWPTTSSPRSRAGICCAGRWAHRSRCGLSSECFGNCSNHCSLTADTAA